MAALRNLHALAFVRQLADQLLGAGIENARAERNADVDVITCRAGAVRALAIDAARGLEQPRVAKVGEGIQVGVGDRPDAAAVAAVTAVRTTERHVLEAQEANAAVRSEEHTSELQSLMRNSYAGFCLK